MQNTFNDFTRRALHLAIAKKMYLPVLFLLPPFFLFGSATTITCTGYATAVTAQSGINNANNATGAPDSQFADLFETNDQIVLNIGELTAANTGIDVLWQRTSGSVTSVTIEVSASANSGFTAVNGSPFSVTTTNYTTQSITLPIDAQYIRIVSNNGFDIRLDGFNFTCNAVGSGGGSDNVGGSSGTDLTGKVFRDFNGNGLQDTHEPLVSGVTVNAYDVNENLCGTAITSGNTVPNYSLTGCTGDVRVEFVLPTTNIFPNPNSLVDFSSTNGGNYGSAVQFVPFNGDNVDFAMNNPEDYWDNNANANPYFMLPCYVNGNINGDNANRDALVGVDYNDSGTNADLDHVATFSEIGTTWGVGFDETTDRYFLSTFLKRHSAFGPRGVGGIYIVTGGNGGSGYSLAASFDLQGVMPNNGGGALDFGNVNRSGTSQSDDFYVGDGPNRDLDAFTKVGKISMGDAAMDDDNQHLYLINLFQKRLIRLNTAGSTASFNNANSATLGPLTEAWDITSLPGAPSPCTGGELRPFAIEIYRGRGFLSLTCDAGSSQNDNNLRAYILEFDPANINAGFTTLLDFDFSYYSENGGWNAWLTDYSQTGYGSNPGGFAFNYLQPLVSNIKFDEEGNMVLALMNRWGHQIGAGQYVPESGNTNLMQGRGQGDVQRVCYDQNTATWQFCDRNNNLEIEPRDDSAPDEIFDDSAGDGADESNVGSILMFKGSNTIIGTTMDPYPPGAAQGSAYFSSGGLHWNDLASGNRIQWVRLFEEDWQDNLNKASGLGDMEAALINQTLEIGNRVWVDTNNDGIQSADENGIDGITIKLFQGSTQVGETITANDGEWYFNRSNVNMNGATGLVAQTAYTIRIESSDFPAVASSLTITGNGNGQPDQRDNDAVDANGAAEINYITKGYGENDHSLDIGFSTTVCPTTICLPITIKVNRSGR